MTLSDLMAKELPMNRKEKFFTGTVFPMIVCRDNFRHFGEFASLIPEFEYTGVSADADSADIQFFTEYSFVESICSNETQNRFAGHPKQKKTPDIMILITRPPKTLLAIEAKMYVNSSLHALKEQMRLQEDILEFLKKTLSIKHVHHCALLPQKWGMFEDFPYHIVTWESLHEKYSEFYAPNDYFMSMLKYSLDSFDRIGPTGKAKAVRAARAANAVKRAKGGMNADHWLSGKAVYDGYKLGSLEVKIMGRKTGLKAIDGDVLSGTWEDRIYQANTHDTPFNANWFHVEDFVERVDAQRT